MIKIKSTSLERSIKSMIPNNVKDLLLTIFCNEMTGYLIKILKIRRNSYGGVFDYSLVDNLTASKIFFGVWESAEVRFAKRFAKNDVIIELGSSIGITFGVLQRVFPKCKFICIEASNKNIKIFKKFLATISANLDLTLINKAISYSNDSKSIVFNEETIKGGKIGANNELSQSNIKIETTTLSEIVSIYVNQSDFTLITDIEGAEADIFFKDEESLEYCTKIICELEETSSYSIDRQVERLQKLGFKIIERYGRVFYFEK